MYLMKYNDGFLNLFFFLVKKQLMTIERHKKKKIV